MTDNKRFRTVTTNDAHELVFAAVCKVLETADRSALYKENGVRLEIWSRHGCAMYRAPLPSPNWRELTHAIVVFNAITGLKGWQRTIQRDDGEIFIVDLSLNQRGEVQVVL